MELSNVFITYRSVASAYRNKGYDFFDSGDLNLNIFGIRAKNSISNHFDDIVGIAFRDNGHEMCFKFNATTDPGKHWLMNPLNVRGTAIMVPGQYKSVYKIGLHGRTGSNPYKALEQVGLMRYVRDNNRDNNLDFDLMRNPKNIFWDNIKSNIHRASLWKIVQFVERYSAGCQVIQDPDDFKLFMEICEDASKIWGDLFTYTLLDEDDFK